MTTVLAADAHELLALARTMMTGTQPVLVGRWPRAAALLGRQALESALADLWRARAPGLEWCSARAQLLCVAAFLDDEALAADVRQVWAQLSDACHHHPYDLPPSATEIAAWLDVVESLISKIADRAATPSP